MPFIIPRTDETRPGGWPWNMFNKCSDTDLICAKSNLGISCMSRNLPEYFHHGKLEDRSRRGFRRRLHSKMDAVLWNDVILEFKSCCMQVGGSASRSEGRRLKKRNASSEISTWWFDYSRTYPSVENVGENCDMVRSSFQCRCSMTSSGKGFICDWTRSHADTKFRLYGGHAIAAFFLYIW